MRDGYPYPGKKLHTILVTPERREGAGEEVTSIVVTGRRGENARSADVLQIDGLISKVCRLILQIKPLDIENLPADTATQKAGERSSPAVENLAHPNRVSTALRIRAPSRLRGFACDRPSREVVISGALDCISHALT